MKIFGEYLRAQRIKVDRSQIEVSRELGYSSSQFVSNWERGISFPPLAAYHQIARIYQVSLDELFEQSMEAKVRELRRAFQHEFEMIAKTHEANRSL